MQLVGSGQGEHHLTGTVADVAFCGYEYAIDLPGHGRLTGEFAPVRANRRESVGLRLHPVHCHVFAADRDQRASPAVDAANVQQAVVTAAPPEPTTV